MYLLKLAAIAGAVLGAGVVEAGPTRPSSSRNSGGSTRGGKRSSGSSTGGGEESFQSSMLEQSRLLMEGIVQEGPNSNFGSAVTKVAKAMMPDMNDATLAQAWDVLQAAGPPLGRAFASALPAMMDKMNDSEESSLPDKGTVLETTSQIMDQVFGNNDMLLKKMNSSQEQFQGEKAKALQLLEHHYDHIVQFFAISMWRLDAVTPSRKAQVDHVAESSLTEQANLAHNADFQEMIKGLPLLVQQNFSHVLLNDNLQVPNWNAEQKLKAQSRLNQVLHGMVLRHLQNQQMGRMPAAVHQAVNPVQLNYQVPVAMTA